MRWVGATVAALFAGPMLGSAAQYQGWLIPDGGRNEKSPMSSVADAATRGKALYASYCARCHGPDGKGDGPDSDYASDLTDDLRTELNTEGVLFYKIWNGRIKYGKGPTEDMPAFQGKLEKDQVWLLVEYLKVLRTPRH
jgi:mono/diheme cytochrome c family protein